MSVQDAANVSRVVARLHPELVRRRRLWGRAAATVLVVIILLVLGWMFTRSEDQSSLGHLKWQTPKGWSVASADTGACHIAPGVSLGPFIGTVATHSMYRQTPSGWECGRRVAVSKKPLDGVVAWVDISSVPLDQVAAADAGASVAGICGGAAGGQAFHSLRVLRGPSEQLRVTLNGCAFGPRASAYAERLDALAASFRYE